MKKIIMLSLVTAVFGNTYVNAGTMGPIRTEPSLTSFLTLEGGYTWNQIDGYNFSLTGLNSRLYSHENNKGFSGRLGGGIMRSISDQFALTSEIGYGYYGRTNLRPVAIGLATGLPGNFHTQNTLSGFDALAGIAYTNPNYNLFFKAGALVQNMRTKSTARVGLPAGTIFQQSINNTAVLPELKVGGAYNVNNNWALTASYLHAFGSNPSTRGDFNVNTLNASFSANAQNPSIDAVMLGIQYSI